jgi:Lar family restriction alleviation protein
MKGQIKSTTLKDEIAIELLDCPFCDGEPKEARYPHPTWDYAYSIFCGGCGVTGRAHMRITDAVNSWNTRKENNQCLDNA